MKTASQALRLFLLLSILTGIIYPLAVLLFGQLLFPQQANGSLVQRNGKLVGSALLAQKFENPRYFWPRPSAADYATVPSGASNLGPTSKALRTRLDERRATLSPIHDPAEEMLTTSGSGLDPHISPLAATQQIARVAAARAIPTQQVETLVKTHTEPPQFHLLGEPRVNVLALNLALDQLP